MNIKKYEIVFMNIQHEHHHQDHRDDDDGQASGELWALDDNKLMVKNFNYDGAGPDAFFWVTFIYEDIHCHHHHHIHY